MTIGRTRIGWSALKAHLAADTLRNGVTVSVYEGSAGDATAQNPPEKWDYNLLVDFARAKRSKAGRFREGARSSKAKGIRRRLLPPSAKSSLSAAPRL